MSFDTGTGTRGGWQPGGGGTIVRWYTKRVLSRIRRTGKLMGLDALVLSTIGRRSGAERTSPVMGWSPGEDGSWLIVAAANGGAKNPAWYYNIAAHPDRVQIETPGRRVAVVAEQLHGTERDEAWRQIAAASRRFAKYQEKTDRQLPIIRLTPRPG
jgi:deazaflavin-dependent oxidoreductase (nitroreductase family)